MRRCVQMDHDDISDDHPVDVVTWRALAAPHRMDGDELVENEAFVHRSIEVFTRNMRSPYRFLFECLKARCAVTIHRFTFLNVVFVMFVGVFLV